MEWISANDRLPECNTAVLIYCGAVVVSTLGCDRKWWMDESFGFREVYNEVTHWMSLPAPPKED